MSTVVIYSQPEQINMLEHAVQLCLSHRHASEHPLVHHGVHDGES